MRSSRLHVRLHLSWVAALALAFVAVVPLHAAKPKAEAAAEEAGDAGSAKEPKGATTVSIEQPIARVHEAALNALAVIGCKVKTTEATYLEGKRSNKMGFAVGSGGEVVKVWLTADGEGRTTVKVATTKTMLGYAGQRSWNQPVIDEINKAFAPADPAAPAAPSGGGAAATP